MSRSRVHQVDFRADLDVETCGLRRIDLSQNNDVASVEHSQMARLPQLVGEPVHDWGRFGDHAFGRWMFLPQTKQSQRQVIAVFVR